MLLYALAVSGGAIAYVPFLTILLPLQVTALTGASDVEWLAYVSFCGAIAASIANIAFGWASDVTQNRKIWVICGLIFSSLLLVAMPYAQNVFALIAFIIVWQLCLNMMLAPLAAWAGDCVPDNQKGILGGLLAFAPAMGALVAAIVTIPGLAGPEGRLFMVAGFVTASVLPVILFGTPRPFPELNAPINAGTTEMIPTRMPKSVIVRMWLARLLIQISEAALFAYLYFWFRSIDENVTDSTTARVFSVILVASIPAALWVGRWADRNMRPILPLPVSAAVAAIGLTIMAFAANIPAAISGYIVFGVSTSIFLALHTAQTLRVLPDPKTRGRDLGLFNLTNTGPSLVMPWLTLALVPIFGFAGLFFALAALALLACVLLLSLPHPDARLQLDNVPVKR